MVGVFCAVIKNVILPNDFNICRHAMSAKELPAELRQVSVTEIEI